MKFAFAYFTEAINTNGGYTKMIAKSNSQNQSYEYYDTIGKTFIKVCCVCLFDFKLT